MTDQHDTFEFGTAERVPPVAHRTLFPFAQLAAPEGERAAFFVVPQAMKKKAQSSLQAWNKYQKKAHGELAMECCIRTDPQGVTRCYRVK